VKGAGALAVAGFNVALFGGYGPDYDWLALTELGTGRAEPAGQYRIVLSDGEPLPPALRSSATEVACTSVPISNGTNLRSAKSQ
jgi:hypothetical protein